MHLIREWLLLPWYGRQCFLVSKLRQFQAVGVAKAKADGSKKTSALLKYSLDDMTCCRKAWQLVMGVASSTLTEKIHFVTTHADSVPAPEHGNKV